ncbi:M3 family oligoendopeptidase [Bacillaceae bacterium S4-13-56]
MSKYQPVWDLEVFFEGGSSSKEFQTYLSSLEKEMSQLKKIVEDWDQPSSAEDVGSLQQIIKLLSGITTKLSESSAFVSCLHAQNVHDKQAGLLRAKLNQFYAQYATILTMFDEKLVHIDSSVWEELLESPALESLSFVLNERRDKAQEKLSLKQEALINDLAVDGYHGWSQMYDVIVGSMTIPFEENGDVKQLSVGQAANKLSSANREIRQQVFEKLSEAWAEKSDLFGETLNHLAGFRLQTYNHRKWEDVLKEPLDYNRMSDKTLTTMWDTISQNKAPLVKYIERKAQLLGLEKLDWYDVGAPIAKTENTMSYDEGADFILEQFRKFGPKMAEFTKGAFENRWIEAEDRPGKRPGGFCTSFPDSKQTRIFMTYSGSASNVSTLAHELGHAFHQHVMNDLEPLNQDYAMNVAETASTFAEMIVADAAVKNASSEEERLALLEDKLQRNVALLMNIHARFLFETKFYEERKKGVVSVEQLNSFMENAQKEAYCDALGSYEPHFWASKLHFHISDVPFYNFPYTFGFLFSLGIYAKAMEEGQAFEDKYIALLQDTGRMKVEDLAKKHLDVDLEQPEFWEKAIELCINDVEEFLQLTEEK